MRPRLKRIDREARLHWMSAAQRERLAAETEEEKQARLHHDKERHREPSTHSYHFFTSSQFRGC